MFSIVYEVFKQLFLAVPKRNSCLYALSCNFDINSFAKHSKVNVHFAVFRHASSDEERTWVTTRSRWTSACVEHCDATEHTACYPSSPRRVDSHASPHHADHCCCCCCCRINLSASLQSLHPHQFHWVRESRLFDACPSVTTTPTYCRPTVYTNNGLLQKSAVIEAAS